MAPIAWRPLHGAHCMAPNINNLQPMCPAMPSRLPIWLCLHLPLFGLEIYSRGHARLHEQPLALVAEHKLLQVSPAARSRGLQQGMSLATARSICASLLLAEQDQDKEHEALLQLGEWAWQFTPHVSLEPPTALLLEVGGSVRLFRGLDRLQQQLLSGIRKLGYSGVIGIGLTPAAALALARAGLTLDADALAADMDSCLPRSGLRAAWWQVLEQQLPERIARLPVASLQLPARAEEALQSMGLARIGQLLQLPRDALGRRFGTELLMQLDRLTGRQVEIRGMLEARPRFQASQHFLQEVTQQGALLFPMRRLLQQLTAWLRARQLASTHIQWLLHHSRHGEFTLTIGCAEPEWQAQRWLELTRLQLERAQLPAAVESLVLKASQLEPCSATDQDMFAPLYGSAGSASQPAHLLDLLQARLGRSACKGLVPQDRHWPEQAQLLTAELLQHQSDCRGRDRAGRPSAGRPSAGRPSDRRSVIESQATEPDSLPLRPLWLLQTPKPLQVRMGQPCREQTPLVLWQGPERIERPSWDAASDAADRTRDYWIALQPPNTWYWIFLAQGEQRWYLHGIFA